MSATSYAVTMLIAIFIGVAATSSGGISASDYFQLTVTIAVPSNLISLPIAYLVSHFAAKMGHFNARRTVRCMSPLSQKEAARDNASTQAHPTPRPIGFIKISYHKRARLPCPTAYGRSYVNCTSWVRCHHEAIVSIIEACAAIHRPGAPGGERWKT